MTLGMSVAEQVIKPKTATLGSPFWFYERRKNPGADIR
jgi:hypothetical protein